MDNEKQLFDKFSEYFDQILQTWTSFRMALDASPEILDNYLEFDDKEGNTNEELEVLSIINQMKTDVFTVLVGFPNIAKILSSLYSDLKIGKTQTIKRIEEIKEKLKNRKYEIDYPIVPQLDDPEEESKNKELIVEKEVPMQVDDDGFTVVAKKSRHFKGDQSKN